MTTTLALVVAGVGWALAVAVAVGAHLVRRRDAGAVRAAATEAGVEPADVDLDAGAPAAVAALELLASRARGAEEARELLARALDAIPEAVIVTDDEGRVRFRNAPARAYDGARHGEALVEAALHELVAGALEGRAEERSLELFGPPRRVLAVSARPLPGRGAKPGVLAVVADLTRQRRLEEVRRDFVANISHELKTPIGAMSLLAETLASEDDDAVARRLAQRIFDEASRVDRTIEDLIVLSRIETESAPSRELLDAGAVLAEAATRIGPAAEQQGLVLRTVEPPGPLRVLGDRRQLVSAMSNLLDNAVKYSEPGGEIEVRVEGDDRHVELTVQDRGIGIPVKDLERIFERFYRVDHARSRQTGGTGLGLAIVRHVAQNHDGEVAVESRLGEGSTFTLRLPAVDEPAAVVAAPSAGGLRR